MMRADERAHAQRAEHLDATLEFLGSLGITPKKDTFYVEINFSADGNPSGVYSSATDTYVRFSIYQDEWNVLVGKPNKASHVRARPEGASVYGTDAFALVRRMPRITELGTFFCELEAMLGVKFPRVAFVRTNIAGAKKAVTKWVATL